MKLQQKKMSSIEIHLNFLYNSNMDKTVYLSYGDMTKCRHRFCGAIFIAKGAKI